MAMHRMRIICRLAGCCMTLFFLLVMHACAPGEGSSEAAYTPEPAQETPAPQALIWEIQAATPAPALQPVPTPEPTPTPTPTPRPVYDDELDSGKYDGFYAKTVFFGDSIMGSFSNYGASHKVDGKFLGGARVIYKVGLSVRLSLKSKVSLRGKEVYVTDAVNTLGADRVVIMLGVNDYAGKYHDATLGHYSVLIDALQEKCPGTEIVIEALLPVTRSFCSKNKINIHSWNAFNPKLKTLCEQKGVGYLDFSDSLKTEEGFLDKGLSRDNQFHLNTEGNDFYLRAVRLYAMLRTEDNVLYAGETPIDILLPASDTVISQMTDADTSSDTSTEMTVDKEPDAPANETAGTSD